MKSNIKEAATKKRYQIIMLICFIFGGFTIMLFALDMYTIIWSGNSFMQGNQLQRESFRDTNFRDFNRAIIDPSHPIEAARAPFSPLRILTSPFSIVLLINGIILIAAGFAIMRITREKEIKKIREEAADQFLLPDEKKVIDTLKKNNFALTQSKITTESGLNKVQVHRVIKRLEAKGLLDKHEYGLTNKIVLKKELFE